MLESIRIKNFQSLHDIDLELGKLTVIVGPSSSGKSAFIRALKAVASNSLHSDYITQGTKHSAVSLTTSKGTATIERPLGGSSAYKVNGLGGKTSSYTKLNRQVPSEVTEVLGITPHTQDVSSINFASQFDAPYLLKEGSSNVARILGELTNVSTIFAAVKEANKKVKNSSSYLNIRKKDLDKVVSQIASYSSLKQQVADMDSAEHHLAQAQSLDQQHSKLATLVDRLERSSEDLTLIPEVPDVREAIKAQQNYDTFVSLLRIIKNENDNIRTFSSSDLEAQSAILSAEKELHRALKDVGQCPLCKQEI